MIIAMEKYWIIVAMEGYISVAMEKGWVFVAMKG